MIRSAPIAIAAMLALGTTPGLAQTAQPTAAPATTGPILQLPVDPAPQPQPSPTITLPPTASPTVAPQASTPPAQPTIELPEVDPPATAREEAAPAPRAAQREAAPARTMQRRAAAPAPAAPITQNPGVQSDVTATDAEPLAAETAPITAAEPVQSVQQPLAADPSEEAQSNWLAIAVLALAGLIPIGFAVFALMWFRRRSRRASAEEVAYTETVAYEPAPEPAAAVAPEPVVVSEPEPAPAPYRPAPAAATRHPLDGYKGMPTNAAVALPQELPETIEERDALLQRMVEAEPDKANPFTSRKARTKRARLILQSLGRTFENVKPRFDLSEYTANWPALAKRRPGYA